MQSYTKLRKLSRIRRGEPVCSPATRVEQSPTRVSHPIDLSDMLKIVTYSPQLKLEASTIGTPAKGNLRLTSAPVDCRRPDSFDVLRCVVVSI